jgi:hypothetical protein
MWSLSTGILFCWTIITSTNVSIIIIMCQVNVFILQKDEIFISISECSWLILIGQVKFMTGTDFQTIVREKDYCEIQIILNLCLIKFSVPESFETYHFLMQQIMILFSGTMKLNMLQIQLTNMVSRVIWYLLCQWVKMRGGCCFIFGIGGIVDHYSLNSHFINLNYLCFLTFWWRLFQKRVMLRYIWHLRFNKERNLYL